tara:strand:- start:2045 stop:3019 length:975 start_codon:yes stop_codon:yes gene_type:complete
VQKKYSLLISELREKLKNCNTAHDIANIKSEYLGKHGYITNEFSKLKNAKESEKKELGKELNILKSKAHDIILNTNITNNNPEKKFVDVTLPGKNIVSGSRHPISITINEITKILEAYGFTLVTGLEVENEYYNFEALNIPESHPARDMHDTFYVLDKMLLRTHTSSVQIHAMLNQRAPLKIMTPGKVYRCDSDPTHSPMFHQIEGLYIDKGINFRHLKGTLIAFIDEYFGRRMEIRFRPSYFPFTEPSAEIDIKFKGKWLEVLGCGMVHHNVLKNVNIDSKKFSGFAFGLGIERLAMLKYGITDLRMFFENDISFLNQFERVK